MYYNSFLFIVVSIVRTDLPYNALVLIQTDFFRNSLPLLQQLSEDQWIISPQVRNERFCLSPSLSRVKLLKSVHLPFSKLSFQPIVLSSIYVPFLEMDCRVLFKKNYEQELIITLNEAKLIHDRDAIDFKGGFYRMIYQLILLDKNNQ